MKAASKAGVGPATSGPCRAPHKAWLVVRTEDAELRPSVFVQQTRVATWLA